MKRVAHRFQISCRIRAITAQSREPPTRLPVNHQPARVTRATVVVPGRMPGTHNVRLDQPPSRAPVTYVVQRNLSFARAKRDRGLLDPFELAREMQTFLFPPVSDQNQPLQAPPSPRPDAARAAHQRHILKDRTTYSAANSIERSALMPHRRRQLASLQVMLF